eukprot:369943_1
MFPELASRLSFFVLALQLWRIDSKSGDYFEYYNQSTFAWSGTPSECTLTATYNSGGGKTFYGCKKESKVYESQQEFDLEYYELLNVCPSLARVPESYRGVPDYSSKNSLPDELVWSRGEYSYSYTESQWGYWCSTGTSYCPRWQCDNSSSLWDRDAPLYDNDNVSYSYHMTTSLSFSSIPLQSSCYQCECQWWTTALDKPGVGRQYAWNCPSARWTWDPISEPFRFRYRICDEETNDPSPQPTPNPAPVPAPTFNPAEATKYCSNNWGNAFISTESYFWDTDANGNCGVVKFCYCQTNGEPYCLSGWDNIMGDDLLYPGFLDKCTNWRMLYNDNPYAESANYLADCWRNTPDSVSRLFSWYDFATTQADCFLTDAALCPRCGCDTDFKQQSSLTNHSYKTSVFYKLENSTVSRKDYVYEYKCTTCNCTLEQYSAINTPRGPLSYVNPSTCDHYDITNNDDLDFDDGDCIEEALKCWQHSGPYKVNGQGTDTCSGQRTSLSGFEDACSFEQFRLDDSSPGDVCVEDGEESIGVWGCADSFECDLYGGDGCYTASFDYEVTQYDCIEDKWLGDTYKADMHYSCCSDEHYCNNVTVEEYLDQEDCTESGELEIYHQFKRECAHSQKNLYDLTDDKAFIRAAFCGDDLRYEDYAPDGEEDEESLCDLLKVYWQYKTFCDCNQKRIRIQHYNDNSLKDADVIAKMLRSQFWSAWTTERTRLTVMYEYWNCGEYDDDDDTFFTCDFDAEADVISNKKVNTDGVSRFSLNTLWWWICGVLCCMMRHDRSSVLLVLVMSACFMMIRADGEYDWDIVPSSSYGDCEFKGTVSSKSSYVCESVTYTKLEHQDEDLPWDVLVDACPNLERGGCYTADDQIDQSELVWPRPSNACDFCPRCPCNNETDTQRHFVKEYYDLDHIVAPKSSNFIYRKCHTCDCVQWTQADDAYAWSCTDPSYRQRYPYVGNDTEFCPATPRPTPAPTEPMQLKCVTGDWDNRNYPASGTSMHGKYGASHCAWGNVTVERYDDGEPHVCLVDELASMGPPEPYFISTNSEYGGSGPICLSIAGDKTGCYYADFDMKVETFDCALNEWISDTYRVDATLFCCNDGYYCNNQTVAHGSASERPSVEYYNYENETVPVECSNSGKLKEFIQVEYQCDYKNHGFDKDYVYARKCKNGATDDRPGCDELRKYWNWVSKCQCAKSQFFLNNVNSTYDEYLNEYFDAVYETTRLNLEKWNLTLGCDWAPGSRWYCSAAPVQSVVVMGMVVIAAVLY